MMNTRYDVAIIGCGEAGIFAGYELKKLRPELNVLVMRMMGMSYNEITLALQLENKSVDNAVQRIRKKVNKSKALNFCVEGI